MIFAYTDSFKKQWKPAYNNLEFNFVLIVNTISCPMKYCMTTGKNHIDSLWSARELGLKLAEEVLWCIWGNFFLTFV